MDKHKAQQICEFLPTGTDWFCFASSCPKCSLRAVSHSARGRMRVETVMSEVGVDNVAGTTAMWVSGRNPSPTALGKVHHEENRLAIL